MARSDGKWCGAALLAGGVRWSGSADGQAGDRMEGLEPRVVQDPIWSNADAKRRVTQKGSDWRRCDYGSMALKR
jgi:hypothetical protein